MLLVGLSLCISGTHFCLSRSQQEFTCSRGLSECLALSKSHSLELLYHSCIVLTGLLCAHGNVQNRLTHRESFVVPWMKKKGFLLAKRKAWRYPMHSQLLFFSPWGHRHSMESTNHLPVVCSKFKGDFLGPLWFCLKTPIRCSDVFAQRKTSHFKKVIYFSFVQDKTTKKTKCL